MSWYIPSMRTRVPSFGQTFPIIKLVIVKKSCTFAWSGAQLRPSAPSFPPGCELCNVVYTARLPTVPHPRPRLRAARLHEARRAHFLAFLCEVGVGFFSTPKAPEW